MLPTMRMACFCASIVVASASAVSSGAAVKGTGDPSISNIKVVPATAQTHLLQTGDLTLSINADGNYTLAVGNLPAVSSHELSLYIEDGA